MARINEDIVSGAEWIAQALSSSGYRADFTPQSLWEIDRFFEDNSSEGVATAGGLLAQDLGQRMFSLGSYMGEVVRRTLGGEWVGEDSDPQAVINVQLKLPSGVICWPTQRVLKRFKNGPEDGIAVWGLALGLKVGSPPPARRGGLFKKLFG